MIIEPIERLEQLMLENKSITALKNLNLTGYSVSWCDYNLTVDFDALQAIYGEIVFDSFTFLTIAYKNDGLSYFLTRDIVHSSPGKNLFNFEEKISDIFNYSMYPNRNGEMPIRFIGFDSSFALYFLSDDVENKTIVFSSDTLLSTRTKEVLKYYAIPA